MNPILDPSITEAYANAVDAWPRITVASDPCNAVPMVLPRPTKAKKGHFSDCSTLGSEIGTLLCITI